MKTPWKSEVNQLRNGKFGHIKFFDTEAVDKAAALAGSPVHGVPIRVDFAEDKPLAACLGLSSSTFPPVSQHFSMVFPWFFHGFSMVFDGF